MESMADGVLLVRRQLGHGLARRVDRQEQWVVAKAMIAAALVCDSALAGALAISDQAVRVDKRDDAHKTRGAVLVGHAFQVNEQLGVVGGIVAMHARIARAIHARLAVQGINDQARIVGNGHEPRLLDRSLRLDDGVLQKRRAVFLGVLKIAQLTERHKAYLGHDLAKMTSISVSLWALPVATTMVAAGSRVSMSIFSSAIAGLLVSIAMPC